MYVLGVFSGLTTMLTYIGLWADIPFTNYLPDYWIFLTSKRGVRKSYGLFIFYWFLSNNISFQIY